MANPVVTIEMENGDIMKAELYPEIAPNTVNNFISLVNKGFYNGLIFHRVISGFMIQGGCPDGTGMGGPGYTIRGEFMQNGYANSLAHTEGVLSMARAMHPDSVGSQFFIMHKNSPHLDGAYAAFGKIIEGMTRMGSGKGSPEFWVAVVKPGRVMFEIAGVSEEVAREALRLASHKLPIKTKIVARTEEAGE